MSTYTKCNAEVQQLANEILCEFESHQPLLDAKVKIDLVFAHGDRDPNTGELLGHALTKNGIRALGITRKINLKDRAMGRGDAEIALDHDWWETASPKERRALLDHELHHISIKIDKRGLVRDDLGRPQIVLRKHDYEFGWFRIIAERHGMHSQEQQQAARIWEIDQLAFWPASELK